MVGHNYGMTGCAEKLTGEFIKNVPTCGIALISLPLTSWNMVAPEKGDLLIFDYPKLHTVDG